MPFKGGTSQFYGWFMSCGRLPAYGNGHLYLRNVFRYRRLRLLFLAFISGAANTANFSVAMWIAQVLTPLQLVLGDLHGRNSFHYQPIKVVAIEGDWDTKRDQSLKLIARRDMAPEHNDFTI